MLINVQVISVVLKKDKTSYVIFGCSLNDLLSIAPLIEDKGAIFSVEGADEDKINGEVYQITGSSSNKGDDEAKCKFKIVCPQIESVKVAELSTLCGDVVGLNIKPAMLASTEE